ncbi:MAG TPA: aspartyl protease family protein [Frankiaceae bacterium]|nr:aspartyl protease family protein [Frankiaceae bacterium]
MAYGGMEGQVRALIDTGSPRTLFGRGVADMLGIDLASGPAASTALMLGGRWDVDLHYVTLTLPPFNDISWETEVDFFRDALELPFEGLLGTQGFLDHWVVSFDYYGSQFVVEERESFAQRLPVDVAKEFLERYDSEWAPPGT